MSTGPFGPRIAALVEQLEKRIVVIDGAMGTMVQARTLGEADYRGNRFKDHPQDLKGDADLLNLVRPDIVEEILSVIPEQMIFPIPGEP